MQNKVPNKLTGGKRFRRTAPAKGQQLEAMVTKILENKIEKILENKLASFENKLESLVTQAVTVAEEIETARRELAEENDKRARDLRAEAEACWTYGESQSLADTSGNGLYGGELVNYQQGFHRIPM